MTTRGDVLKKAQELTEGDRNEEYGEPSSLMQLTWDMWVDYTRNARGKYCGAHNAAMFLAINKLSRIAHGNSCNEDHYVDLAAYAAIAFEAELEFRRSLSTSTTDEIAIPFSAGGPPPLDEVGL